MKLLFVDGDGDYSALSFENAHRGTKVSDILDNISAFESEDGDWELSVEEVGEVSPEFLKFVRNKVQDYDDSKHQNFYLENETVED